MSNSEVLVSRDEEGYLIEPDDWSKEMAIQFAVEEALELSDDHWTVINFIRDSFEAQKIIPDIRHAAKHLASELGCDKKEARNRMFKLFPYGYVKQTCKIAGMKRPRGWSTG